ncbi:MAG TPA: sulfurtransferase complex subunit TusD [Psychromonas hadalis]|nr:sulfurtransferase complex subunit TusD [Psychromonas hadalis]
MAIFTIMITGAPYGTQGASSGYLFCKAALEMKHTLAGVFFYQQGVFNANALTSPASDEVDLPQCWADLAIKHGFPLEVCVSAALRRGVLSEDESKQLGLSQHNLKFPFVLSGLGQFAELSAKCDRLVQFK